MSDTEQVPESLQPDDQPRPGEAETLVEKDINILTFIKFARAGVEVPITLQMNGLIVSGVIIGRARYEELMVEVTDSFGNEFLSENRRRTASIIKEKEEGNQERDDILLPDYIHLRDSRFHFPGARPIPPYDIPGVPWRGKIRSIDGFVLGSLESP